ncbi:uncharacterized protein LOC110688950 [Chenopodium quinoa]|uniref:uncharacterized protein LOC110688950 n=1 Tax=Chenopodium quinoa TaxID=63459 RepID=UPI000B788F55|nr:uncharacterized protein LOC110688950 [Chenopodium quinoa]
MMGVQKLYFPKSQFIFLFRKMILLIRILWVSFFTLFGMTRKCIFRLINHQKDSNFKLIQPQEEHQTNDKIEVESKIEEESEPVLRFRFPTFEEFLQKNDINNNDAQSTSYSKLCENSDENVVHHVESKDDCVESEIDSTVKASHEFLHVEEISKRGIGSESEVFGSEKNGIIFDEFLHVENVMENILNEMKIENGEELCEMVNDSTNKMNVVKNGSEVPSDAKSLVNDLWNDEDIMRSGSHLPSDAKSLVNDSTNDEDIMINGTEVPSDAKSLVNGSKNDEDIMRNGRGDAKSLVNDSMNDEDIMKNGSEVPSDAKSLVNNLTNDEDIMRNGSHLPSDDESLVSDLSSESSFRSSFIDSFSDEFLSDIDFERAFEVDTSTEFGWNEVNLTKEALEQEDLEFQNLSKGYEADDFDDEDDDILNELKKLESNLEGDDNGDSNKEHQANMETEPETKQEEEKQSSGEQLSSDSDEQNGLETQWEHQDLVEQLKMEIKKVRAIGLPTILEESESPKIMDDLKPWKIEGKYKPGGTLDELNKFYKSYKERMRKLDILNYQKMYAIGFLRLKDPLKSISKNRISTPALATIVSLDCWPCKPKISTEINQPVMKKFSRELESDLEMVYVGQMCLSWEFLRWQYGKALDLWETDPHGIHRYNEVADKFQTFQVLLTRFLEDERFQGPRVQNYVKNRCVQRNLLQVPLIRDDNASRKKEKKYVSSKDAVTSLQLVEVIEDSIRVLWRFIKSDKDTTYIGLLKCRKNSNVELQNPADASLLDEIQSSLQKKEKKLKDLVRSGKCVLKKIQKHQQEEGSDHVLYFFSQVDLRLVSRVLNMPRITTEQLVWCSDKLNKIRLVDRKLHVDTSVVLLFPC